MCPGRFPSPTPSRDASPMPSVEDRRPSSSMNYRANYLNFTAPISSRKRPRFAETQSDSVIDHDHLSISSTPDTGYYTTAKRRISDPMQDRLQSLASTTAYTNPQQRQSRRAVSSPSGFVPPGPSSQQVPRASAQPSASQSSRLIDIKLRKKLQEPLTPQDTRGIIYVLQDPSNLHRGYKIGWTTRMDHQIRINEHRYTCRFEPKEIHVVYDVENSFRAEQLIHIDLKDREILWPCNGHKAGKTLIHEEWHQVTEAVAIETVNKWARFMNVQRPYYWRRQLSPFREYLLRARKLVNYNDNDHDSRREQWDLVLAPPTPFDYIKFVIDLCRRAWHAYISLLFVIWPLFTAFFWQTLTVTYGFVTLMVFRNTFASSAFALVSVCACVSAARQGLPKRVRSRGT
jgi:hypothetical protein